MNKNYRVEIADKTLEIIQNGFYEYKGKKIVVEKELEDSIQNTFTIAPNDWNEILKTPIENKFETAIVIKNCSTIEAIVQEKKGKICVLNFASAKNPGGGFLGGLLPRKKVWRDLQTFMQHKSKTKRCTILIEISPRFYIQIT